MEISILSREIIKPSNPNIQSLPPLKLNLLDQLTPSSYSPLILFYQNNNQSNISKQLKWSLSETLSLYYPMSGRVRDNFVIHDFHEGVPFVETRVGCRLCDFLHDQEYCDVGVLNNLLPLQTQQLVLDDTGPGPQLAVQLNVFECGGWALGLCSLHKTNDGVTCNSFFRTWSAINNGTWSAISSGNRSNQILRPNFSEGPLAFPPMRSIPPRYSSLARDLWFGSKGEPVTRRFVFDHESVSKLREKAKTEHVNNPTRADALSAFVWKSTIHASASCNNHRYKPSTLSQTVDLRRLTRPRLSRHSFGNLILFTGSVYHPKLNGEPRIEDLTGLVKSGVTTLNSEFLRLMIGEKGRGAVFDYFDQQAESENEEVDVLNVACWHGFGFGRLDFGCGPAVWVGLGGPGTQDDAVLHMLDTMILVDNNKGGLEAWLTLKDPTVMRALERDLEFLEFAAIKSTISSE
ncbi:Stemmadenine O-acetyltransferase [Linum perenne]